MEGRPNVVRPRTARQMNKEWRGGKRECIHPGVEGVTVRVDVDEVHEGEDERGDSDEDRPERDEEVCERGIDDRWVISNVFENVEPVASNDDG